MYSSKRDPDWSVDDDDGDDDGGLDAFGFINIISEINQRLGKIGLMSRLKTNNPN